MQWREESVAGRGARLHVRRVVDPVAPPVLLLHGLGVDGSIWQGFARRLLPDLAAVVPDLRGHGQSDAPPTGYTPTDYAGDLIEFLQAGEGRSPVVGHSLGALVALKLAALRPDLVPWLVLLDPPLDPELRNPEIASVARLRHAPAGELEAYLLERNPSGGQLLAQTLARLFRQASDATFDTFLEPTTTTTFVDEALKSAPGMALPCLVVQADPARGGVLGDAAARAFVERLRQGRLLQIPGAPHALHASHPSEIARAILDFNR